MELFLDVLLVLGLIILGWCLAEVYKSFSGRSENITVNNPRYFSFIGIIITQKDAQKLFLSLILGFIAFMILLDFETTKEIEFYKFKLDGDILKNILYVFIGIAPSTVMALIKKKASEKLGIKERDLKVRAGVGGELPPDDDEQG